MDDILLAGHYQILSPLGTGGMGQTFIAEDIHLPGNPKCVVKKLQPANQDPHTLSIAKRLFYSEAETLQKLGQHDQIPQLQAYFEENHSFYLVQELIEGNTLTNELPIGQHWPETNVSTLLEEVLELLVFVHSQKVIHRDLKPDNIIRRHKDQKLVLIDFGAVKEVRAQTVMASQMSQTVSIGTPGYMPTEQTQGKPRYSSDLYALGMIAIQALTGFFPTQLRDDDEGEIVWRDHAVISDGMGDFLSKMIRYHFKDRFRTAEDALLELQQIRAHGHMSTVFPTTSVQAQSTPPAVIPPPVAYEQTPASFSTTQARTVASPPVPEVQRSRGTWGPVIIGTSIIAASLVATAAIWRAPDFFASQKSAPQPSAPASPEPLPSITSSPSSTTIPPAISKISPSFPWLYQVVNVKKYLHIRENPSGTAKKVGCLPSGGSNITVIGAEPNSGWLQVEDRGVTGWVNGTYLIRQATGPTGQNSTIPSNSLPKYSVINVKSNDVLYVHSGPAYRTKDIACLPYDATNVAVIDGPIQQRRGSPYIKIQYLGVTGWVNSKFLSWSLQ